MTPLCSRCGQEPRAGTNRWGKACLAGAKRKSRSNARSNASQTPLVADPACLGCTALTAVVKALKAEIEHLKVPPPTLAQVKSRARVGLGRMPNAKPGQATPVQAPDRWKGPPQHGPRCRCYACQAGRR